MKIAVVINQNAGHGNVEFLKKKIQDSLYRCDLDFLVPSSVDVVDHFITSKVYQNDTDYFIFCGGDGTVNVCIQPLVRLQLNGLKIPPVCIVPAGTANDLASGIGLSRRVEKTVRTILDGKVKNIDLIEIKDETDKVAYMISNGGLGIPAETAEKANAFRSFIKKGREHYASSRAIKNIFTMGQSFVRESGSMIYGAMLMETLLTWKSADWEFEFEATEKSFSSHAPIILINNQPITGSLFKTAPLTSNTDGTFNILFIKSVNLKYQLKSLIDITRGQLLDGLETDSLEVKELKIRAKGQKPMKFFGDGEILFSEARELRIKCINPGLPITVSR